MIINYGEIKKTHFNNICFVEYNNISTIFNNNVEKNKHWKYIKYAGE